MVSQPAVLVVGATPLLLDGIQQRLWCGSPGYRCQIILGSDLPAIPARVTTELVIVMPRDCRDLHACLSLLRQCADSLPWLVIADLPRAGTFFRIHDPHLCGLLSHHATTDGLQAAVAALIDGHPLFRPYDMLRLLLDLAVPPAQGNYP
jgi:hypothetical protein